MDVVPVASFEPAKSGDGAPQAGALTADPRQPKCIRRHLRVGLVGAALVVWLAAALSWQLAAGGGESQAVPGAHGLSGHILSLKGGTALVAGAPDGSEPVRRDLGFHDSELGLHLLANLFVINPGGGAGADQRVHKVLVNQCGPMGQLAMPKPFSDE